MNQFEMVILDIYLMFMGCKESMLKWNFCLLSFNYKSTTNPPYCLANSSFLESAVKKCLCMIGLPILAKEGRTPQLYSLKVAAIAVVSPWAKYPIDFTKPSIQYQLSLELDPVYPKTKS